MEAKANVFDVEYYGTKDGPGIRTVLFLKGCNLTCRWCHNPESQSATEQILYHSNLCVNCGRCLSHCPTGAIHYEPEYGYVTDQRLCDRCGACVEICSYQARELVGRVTGLQEIQEMLLRDEAFYKESGGGITISGGEPLMQRGVVKQLLVWLKGKEIHTAPETAGAYPSFWLEEIIE